MTKPITHRTISIDDKINDKYIFPIERTCFDLLEKDEGIKERVLGFVEEWKKRNETLKEAVERKNQEAGVDTYIRPSMNPKPKHFRGYFKKVDKEEDIINKTKPIIIQTLTSFIENKETDNNITQFLRQIIKEETEDWENQIKTWPAGMSGMFFMEETIKNFYLAYLPKWLEEKLNITEPVKLDDIQEPLKKILVDEEKGVFTTLYAGFTSTDKRGDLDDFQQKINNGLTEIETLIENTRKNKTPEKPKEDIEAIKKELEQTKARLKIYDDAFGYLYPLNEYPNGTQMISDWWNGLNTEWKTNFKEKYGIIYSENLKKVKKDLDDKEKQINEWLAKFPIKDYPNGAEGIQELINKLKENQGIPSGGGDKEIKEALDKWLKEFPIENYPKGAEEVKIELEGFSAYIERVLDRLEKQDNYILVDEPDKITTDPEEIKT
jgi:hypothetical protein